MSRLLITYILLNENRTHTEPHMRNYRGHQVIHASHLYVLYVGAKFGQWSPAHKHTIASGAVYSLKTNTLSFFSAEAAPRHWLYFL